MGFWGGLGFVLVCCADCLGVGDGFWSNWVGEDSDWGGADSCDSTIGAIAEEGLSSLAERGVDEAPSIPILFRDNAELPVYATEWSLILLAY